MTALTFNEGKACDAVIRVLEAREGASRRNVRLPEKEGHAAPVEIAVEIGDRLFALEHTGIEPFPGHVKMENQGDWLINPIRTMVQGKLPPDDTFELGLPINAFDGLKGKDLVRVHTALSEWVIATAPTMAAAPYGSYLRTISKVQPAGVPFSVRLDRFGSVGPPALFIIRFSLPASDLEPLRESRLRIACVKKLPKLEAWRLGSKARSVLVLEDNDIFLTNPEPVFQGMLALRPDFPSWPDEIYMVSTMIKAPWYVHALWVGDRQYYELSRAGICMTQFDPDQLVDVTAR